MQRVPIELLPRLLVELRRFLDADRRAFRHALHAWAKALWADTMSAEAAFPSFKELEQEKEIEMTTMLHARWERYDASVRAEGVAQGRAEERARLRRQAGLKFGASAAEQLSDGLAMFVSRADLDRVSDWIIECESGEELLTRVRSVLALRRESE